MSQLTDALKTGLRAGVGLAVKAVIASAVTALPFLGVPPIINIFNWGVNWVINQIMPYLETWLADTVFDIQVNAEKNAFEKAREELRLTLAAHVRNPQELQDASDEFDRRLGRLIRVRP